MTVSQEGEENEDGEGAKVQVTLPDESQLYKSVHGLWKWGTSALFDMQIVNLDTGSYVHQKYAKALSTAENEKKDKYLHNFLDCRNHFIPMVYSADIIPGTEALSLQQSTSLLLSNKLYREYLEICGFIRAWVSLSIVSYNTLLLCDVRDKEAYIL